MKPLQIHVGGVSYEGHYAVPGDGTVRLISKHGSRTAALGNLTPELLAEMLLTEVVQELHLRADSEAISGPADGVNDEEA
jgi:hypothetical protein